MVNIKSLKRIFPTISLSSYTLILLVTLYFAFPLNVRFWQFIYKTVNFGNLNELLFAVSLLFFITIPFFLFFSLILLPKVEKIFIICLLLMSSLSQYAMLHYGIYIDKNMMQNVFETNSREAFDLLTFSCVFWVFLMGVIPSIIVCFVKVKYDPFKKELIKRTLINFFLLLFLAITVGLLFKEYASFGRNNHSIKGLINGVNYIAGTTGYIKRLRLNDRVFKKLDTTAEFKKYEDDLPTVLIFVLSETARAKNFSLNGYHRETNPLLKNQDIIYFHNVSACGTSTAVSVPCIFSNFLRNNFNSTDARYQDNLLDLLQTAGCDVIWKENDDGCKGVCDRVKTEIMLERENSKFCTKTYCYDEVLLEDLSDTLKNISKDTIIVLHTMGSHGPTYYNRYPEQFKKFTPTCDTADIQNCTVPQIVNTYDNTILYTDYIISKAIDILNQFPALESGLIYASDHGESLGENNVYLHGMPYRIAPDEQTDIPMILWMSESMKKYDHIDYACVAEKAKKIHTLTIIYFIRYWA